MVARGELTASSILHFPSCYNDFMNKGLLIGIIVVVLVGVGLIFFFTSGPVSAPAPQGSTTTNPASTDGSTPSGNQATTGDAAQTTSSAPSTAPAPQSFTVHGDDLTADLTNITVPKGTPVSITFFVNVADTYHGGLDFRSSVLNTGTILPGAQKTITFTADQSFSFTPYWPASNVAKPYKINITVQ